MNFEKDIYIFCPYEKDLELLTKAFKILNIKWSSLSFKDMTNWEDYTKETVYRIDSDNKLHYGDLDYYLNKENISLSNMFSVKEFYNFYAKPMEQKQQKEIDFHIKNFTKSLKTAIKVDNLPKSYIDSLFNTIIKEYKLNKDTNNIFSIIRCLLELLSNEDLSKIMLLAHTLSIDNNLNLSKK